MVTAASAWQQELLFSSWNHSQGGKKL